MKKLLVLLLSVFAFQFAAQADNDKPIELNQLPSKAQQFLNTYFKGKPVSFSKVDTGLFDKNYDVIFTNGDKIEFDKKGEWTDVSCKYSKVPEKVVPIEILKYVSKKYPGTDILQIEKDNKKYDVKLSNKLELKFDRKFKLIGIDD